MKRVIVCGGRDYDDAEMVRGVISMLALDTIVVHGSARGADSLASKAAEDLGLFTEAHPADWDTHGKPAGFIRNQEMLDAGADLVIAFPGGRGTADMVRRARRANIAVLEVQA